MTAPPRVSPVGSPARLIGRAMSLRCPSCGAYGLFRHWVRLEPRCPSCGAATDRGAPGHFVGAYLVNLILAELLFAIGFGAWVILTWPDVPWDRMEWVGALAMLIAPLLLYPITRTVWLAVDLILDPEGERPPGG